VENSGNDLLEGVHFSPGGFSEPSPAVETATVAYRRILRRLREQERGQEPESERPPAPGPSGGVGDANGDLHNE